MFVTYYWKGLKESYNFVVESISIKIHMKMLQSHKLLGAFVLEEHGCSPKQLKPLFPLVHGCSRGFFHVL
jgi:hypothetical protein